MSLLQLLFLLCSFRLVAAAARTIAIDDTYGDEATGALPVYSPAAKWSQGQPCASDDDECLVRPDPNMVRNGTWHDSVGSTDDAPPRTIDLAFEGNSIAVYCIVSEVDRVEIAVSNMTFELDGQEVGRFYHDVSGQMDASGNYAIRYNVQVFNGSVAEGKHTLRISSVGFSRMLFDYALYTSSSDLATTAVSPSSASPTNSGPVMADTSPSARPSVGVIVGAVAAGAVALLAAGITLFVFLRGRRRRTTSSNADYSGDVQHSKWLSQGEGVPDTHVSTVESLPYEDNSPTLSDTYPQSSSRYRGDPESSRQLSPSESAVPLIGMSPPHRTLDPFSREEQPRLVVVGAETRLAGPDNAMARLARQQFAKHEAELARRVREVQDALTKGTPAGEPSDEAGTPTFTSQLSSAHTGAHTGTGTRTYSTASQPRESSSEVVLHEQLNELRAEMERMKMAQQQMTLEIREAIEPPPGYHAT